MKKYRADIDGLRALAVIAVVLFHADINGFGGGFVGVDVFFVISGFLITNFILAEIREGKFSIKNFYERRIRRIFPALFTMMLVCSLAAWWLLLPSDFAEFADSAVWTTLFVSNFYFWQLPSYFSPAVELSPLLHTWSLAIEEQFYIVYPVVLVALFRFAKGKVVHIIALFFFVSLALSIWLAENHPHGAFYLAPSRAWELFLGALLAFGIVPQSRDWRFLNAATIIGILLILWSVFAYTSATTFPGLAALIPCLGTALIIYGGSSGATMVSRLLSLRPIVFVGLISYSLYLWHWPALALTKYFQSNLAPPLYIKAIAIAAATGLAVLSWHFVERPFRDRRRISRRLIGVSSAGLVALMLAFNVMVSSLEGVPQRFDERLTKIASARMDVSRIARNCMDRLDPEDVRQGHLCEIGAAGEAAPSFLLWGDSHAAALMPAISEVAARTGYSGLMAVSSTCPPLIGVQVPSNTRKFSCMDFNQAVKSVNFAANSPDTVILNARWALYAQGTAYKRELRENLFISDAQSNSTGFTENHAVFIRGLRKTLAFLRDAGKRIIVVGPSPEIGWDVPRVLAMQQYTSRYWRISPTYEEFLERQVFVISTLIELAAEFDAELIFPHETLCNQEICSVMREGHILYSDYHHLSLSGATTIRQIFKPIFRELNDAQEQAEPQHPGGAPFIVFAASIGPSAQLAWSGRKVWR